MNCQRARHLLSDRLDHPLAPADATTLAAHLRDCADCARYDAQLRAGMGQLARLPVAPRRDPAAAARPHPSRPTAGGWLVRGGQVALAVLAIALVVRLTTGLIGPRAALLDRPAEPSVVAMASASGPEQRSFAPASSAAPPVIQRAPASASAATPSPRPVSPAATPRPIDYGREWALGDQDQLWSQLARAHGESLGAILRPGYLPLGFQRARAGQVEPGGQFAVVYSGTGAQQLRITAGIPPEELYTATTLAASPTTVTVRGQNATLLAPVGADSTLILLWEEPGRWASGGGLFGTDRIPYSISASGLGTGEIERIAATLAPQTTAPLASDVVRRFYAAINGRDFRGAFALFDERWAQTYEDFSGGFANTTRDDLDILRATATDTPGRYSVAVRLLATRTDGARQWYGGTYEVGGAPGAARIASADIRELTEEEANQLVATVPPNCTDAQINVVVVTQLIEDGRVLDAMVGVTNGGPACRLVLPLTVTITFADGRTAPLTGNAATLTPNGTMGAFNLGLAFQWTNWCGAAGPATLRATLGPRSATGAIPQPPACTDAAAASQLQQK